MKNLFRNVIKENRKLEDKLIKTNKDTLDTLLVYIKSKETCEVQTEIIKNDLLKKAIKCEEKGKSFRSILGANPISFCDDLLENTSKEPILKKVIDIISISSLILIILSILQVITSNNLENVLNLNPIYLPITLGLLFYSVVVIAMLLMLFKIIDKYKYSRKISEKNTKQGLLLFIGVISYILVYIISLKLNSLFLFNVNTYLFLGIVIVLSVISNIFRVKINNEIYSNIVYNNVIHIHEVKCKSR